MIFTKVLVEIADLVLAIRVKEVMEVILQSRFVVSVVILEL